MTLQRKAQILFLLVSFLILAVSGCQRSALVANADESVTPLLPTATAVPPTIEPRDEAEPAPTQPPAIVTVVVTATPMPENEQPPAAEPANDAPQPTATPIPLDPTATPAPPELTSTPLPEPTATSMPVLGPSWLNLFNHVRAMSGLTAVPEQYPLTTGSELHSRYMVVNDTAVAHKQDVNNPLYDPAGNQAALNGNLFATSQMEANYVWGINFWVSAPFHLIPMLHPRLESIGYGDYIENGGDINMAAVMDVRSAREGTPDGVQYPIFFPGDGSETWVVRHSLYEWPDAVGSCPGYARPTGAPIIVQFGDGSTTPSVSSFTLWMGDKELDACLFGETTYRNADSYAQKIGRTILDEQDAVVILPRQPLAADAEYTVQITANGYTYSWSFNTIKRAPTD